MHSHLLGILGLRVNGEIMKPPLRLLPAKLNDLIEGGEEILLPRKLFVRAVVGAVYFKGELPEIAAAAVRMATEHGMVVLKSTPKEILFLANYFETANWPLNLMAYFEALMQKSEGRIRASASMGPATLLNVDGELLLESDEASLAYFMSRSASPGQIALTSKVWHALSDSLEGWKFEAKGHTYPGFTTVIPTVHLESRLCREKSCPKCSCKREIKQNDEGYIYLFCPKGHEEKLDTLPLRFKRSAA